MPPQNQTPYPPGQPVQTNPPDYGFIMDPSKPPRRPIKLPGADSSLPIRLLIIAAGVIALLIVFLLLKGLLSSKPKLDSYVTVAQDQQEIIHLTTNATQQPDLSSFNKTVTATIQLTMNSAQDQITAYLAQNHFKVNPKLLAKGVNPSLDTQLGNAETAGTYNQVYTDTMKSQLNNYMGDLSGAYNQSSGPKGKALLKSDYAQVQLLLDQLNAPPAAAP